jgi:DNA-binding response OmpR family regulator
MDLAGNVRVSEKTVMIIDDDEAFGAVLRRALEQEGFVAIARSQPHAALDELGARPVDAVVVDKEMPGLGGLELVAQARVRHPALSIVLMTAFGGARVGAEARARGADAYLEKPFFVRDLVAVLHSLQAR